MKRRSLWITCPICDSKTRVKVFENTDIAAGANAESLEFNENISGVGSVEFFLYDSITSPKPLMRGYKIER